MIRVMIVEEIDLLRGALVALLSKEDDLSVVAELSWQDRVVARAAKSRPDVVVLSVDRDDRQVLDTAVRLALEAPASRVLVIATAPTPDVLQHVPHAHVLGFVGKDVTPDHLAEVIREVAAGRRVIDPAITAALLRAIDCPLTHRELEILRDVAEGLRSAEVAQRLNLAPGTIRNYLSAIIRKTGATNRTEAIRRAAEAGWL